MTLIFPAEKVCFNCGEVSDQYLLGSTNAFGPSDLDTRPPEMQRSTISHWIQSCPKCFYCAPDISKGDSKIKEIINSQEYKKNSRDDNFPDKSVEFLSHSYIMDKLGEYENAAWACLHAAWYSDDEEMEYAASLCREKAFNSFKKAKELDETILSEPNGVFDALMVDLLRRIPKLPEASDYCNQAINRKPDDLIMKILHYQRVLIKKRDTGCYTIVNAIINFN